MKEVVGDHGIVKVIWRGTGIKSKVKREVEKAERVSDLTTERFRDVDVSESRRIADERVGSERATRLGVW